MPFRPRNESARSDAIGIDRRTGDLTDLTLHPPQERSSARSLAPFLKENIMVKSNNNSSSNDNHDGDPLDIPSPQRLLEPLGKPRPGDWLDSFSESGQSFREFAGSARCGSVRSRCAGGPSIAIALVQQQGTQHGGSGGPYDDSSRWIDVDALCEIAAAFFQAESVAVRVHVADHGIGSKNVRKGSLPGHARQYNGSWLIDKVAASVDIRSSRASASASLSSRRSVLPSTGGAQGNSGKGKGKGKGKGRGKGKGKGSGEGKGKGKGRVRMGAGRSMAAARDAVASQASLFAGLEDADPDTTVLPEIGRANATANVSPTRSARPQRAAPRGSPPRGTAGDPGTSRAPVRAPVSAAIGITMLDIYNRDLNFVFGLAKAGSGVAVFSLARKMPRDPRDGGALSEDEKALLFERATATVLHELGHIMGLKHCVFFRCVMQGSNSLEESDARPLVLCPVCLRKLHLATGGFDPAQRFRDFARAISGRGGPLFRNTERWLAARLGGDL